jgi:hypothetical protein
VRRVLQRIDGDALDATIRGWLIARANAPYVVELDTQSPSLSRPRPPRAAVAVDGKSLRGASHDQSAPIARMMAPWHGRRHITDDGCPDRQ